MDSGSKENRTNDEVMRERLKTWRKQKSQKKPISTSETSKRKQDRKITPQKVLFKQTTKTKMLEDSMRKQSNKFIDQPKPSTSNVASSPSMRHKLEEWKAKRQLTQSASKLQPFRCGKLSQPLPVKTPCRASEKMKLLAESSSCVRWGTRSISELKHQGNSALRNINQQSRTCFKAKQANANTRRKTDFVVRKEKRMTEAPRSARRETFSLKEATLAKEEMEQSIKKQLDFEETEIEFPEKNRAEEGSSQRIDNNKETFDNVEEYEEKFDNENENTTDQSLLRRSTFDVEDSLNVSMDISEPRAEDEEPVTLYSHVREHTPRPKTVQSMREKLEEWLRAKGKTPRKVTKLTSTPRIKRRRSEMNVTPRHESNVTIEDTIARCKQMLKEGCPPPLISDWLDELQSKLPELQSVSSFQNFCNELKKEIYIRQNKENMVQHSELSASDDLISFSPFKLSCSQPLTSKPPASAQKSRRRTRNALTPLNENSPASQIKFHIKEATPYFQRIQNASGKKEKTPSTMFVTPVRRSVRLAKRRSMMTPVESEDCVGHLAELPFQEATRLILRSNRALDIEFNLDA